MIITASGAPGAGKSTITKKLAEILEWKRVSAGEIVRMRAAQRGITLEECYKEMGNNPNVERLLDFGILEMMKENDNLIVDARLGFYLAKKAGKQAIHLYFNVHPLQGAERLAEREDHRGQNIDDVRREAHERQLTERKRDQKLYDIENHQDPSHFDIVIDTTPLRPDQVFRRVLMEIGRRLLKEGWKPDCAI